MLPCMPKLLTAHQAAEMAGVSVATISREVTRGNLKPHPDSPGSLRVFRETDVARWIRKRADKAAS